MIAINATDRKTGHPGETQPDQHALANPH